MRATHILAAVAVALGGAITVAAPAAAVTAGVPDGTTLTPSGSLTITEDGTVIDGLDVHGNIHIKADDVTIMNTRVTYGGNHSIRVDSDVENAQILHSTVNCENPKKTNGITFGNYYAEGVAIEGCRHDFMSSEKSPAVVVDSTVDGVPYELNAGQLGESVLPEPAPGPESGRDGFPTAETTGVPDGVRLTDSGGLTITEPGTVVEGMHIRGTVTIAADDVTIRNSLIETGTPQYPVKVEKGVTGALIENVEIDNQDGTGIGVFFKGAGTLRGADIHSAEDGIRIEADNVTVEDTYIHDLFRQPGGHHDALQIRKGDNITIRGNNFQAYRAATDDPMNAAIQIGSLLGDDPISNLVVEDNLFNGGNFTINGGKGIVDSARYSRNQFGPNYRYGAVGNLADASRWDDSNVWQGTDTPVR
ncbi:right-handed parallel beta-helix repeat-containing protein [Georgenia wutianyii]|nr:right-handed parallel beta-helix repeat-containing protein [Georgenia wutianyii]